MKKLFKNKELLVNLNDNGVNIASEVKIDYTKSCGILTEILAYELIDSIKYTPN
jgi:hypothetical protein